MPPRKPHSKSRRGCLECKRRHTKCDEQHPRCRTCTRLEIDCTWPEWRPRNASPASPAEDTIRASTPSLIARFNNVSKGLTEYRPASRSIGDLEIDDLKLLHHYTLRTYATLDSVLSQRNIWRESIIEIGFQHPYLLRGVLAIAALHLAILNPDLSAEYVIKAAYQHSLALQDFRIVLPNVGEDNCVPVFAFSCITVIHAFAVAQIHSPQEPISDFLNCLRLVQGVGAVLRPHYVTLLESDLSPILDNSPKGDTEGEVPEILGLKALVKSMSSDSNETVDSYLHAIDWLHTISLESRQSGDDHPYLALIFSWPALITPIFTSHMSRKEPVALIIMAYFVSIMGHKKRTWWVRCSDISIIDDIESRLSPELLHWLIWPRQMCEQNEIGYQ